MIKYGGSTKGRHMQESKLFTEERQARILAKVEELEKVTVAQLCETFSVSGATIRSDLRELHRMGRLIRTHGGAIRRTKTGFELGANSRKVQHLQAKRAIARAAVALIQDGDRIILDTGTTTLQMAQLLRDKQDLTVVTNDLEIAISLEEIESIQVILLGGVLRQQFHCTVGPSGIDELASLTVDKAFLGANGFGVEEGASTPDVRQAQVKKAMIAASSQVIVLCDHSKFGKTSFVKFADLSQIDIVITDSVEESQSSALEAQDIEVIVG